MYECINGIKVEEIRDTRNNLSFSYLIGNFIFILNRLTIEATEYIYFSFFFLLFLTSNPVFIEF